MQLREAARAALSDSKPEGSGAADGGRQLARSRLSAVLEMAERLLVRGGFARGHLGNPSRHVGFSPGDGTSATTTTRRRSTSLRCPLPPAARRAVRRTYGGADLRHAVGGRDFRRRRRFARIAGGTAPRRIQAPTWAVPSITPARACCTWHASAQAGPGPSSEQLDELEELMRASRGGALGLFSSRRAAEEAAAAMRTRPT